MSTHSTVGDRIKSHRVAANLTQRDLAARLGVSQATINRWEHGQFDDSLHIISTIADEVGTTCCQIIGCEDKP